MRNPCLRQNHRPGIRWAGETVAAPDADGDAQLIMLGELAVNRVLDNLEFAAVARLTMTVPTLPRGNAARDAPRPTHELERKRQ